MSVNVVMARELATPQQSLGRVNVKKLGERLLLSVQRPLAGYHGHVSIVQKVAGGACGVLLTTLGSAVAC